jgi:hypothetical protein
MKMDVSARTIKALETGQAEFLGSFDATWLRSGSHEEISVRDQRENKPKNVSDKKDNSNRQRKALGRGGRPIIGLTLSGGVKIVGMVSPTPGPACALRHSVA